MKTKFIMTMAVAAMTLAACSNNDNDADNWNGEIRLSSGLVVQSRANKDVPDKQIAENQTVKVVVTKQNGDTKDYAGYNLDFTADGNGGLSNANTTMYYPTSGKGVNICAYHPADAGTSFSVEADQSTDANYYKSDLLYSAANDYPRKKEALSLSFTHKLCKVKYTLMVGTGGPNLGKATVQWLNVDKTIGFTAATGDVATPIDAVAITPNATYGAIIVPQTVKADTKLLQVTLENGGVLYYTPTVDQIFESGKEYTYEITVNLTKLDVTSFIDNWISVGKEPIKGNATME